MKINLWRELEVHQNAFASQKAIFEFFKGYPTNETYSLIDQSRGKSRAGGANNTEACRRGVTRRFHIKAHRLGPITKRTLDFLGRQHESMNNRHEPLCF